ncbi:hypothetical protein BJX66DRAFT_291138 [Aspergillus keveii]|uniref:Uncharacterized protein n=1 Tax=Aspergillus keveii TaxID=714993 RepID=A0ABR4GPU7_9EURO
MSPTARESLFYRPSMPLKTPLYHPSGLQAAKTRRPILLYSTFTLHLLPMQLSSLRACHTPWRTNMDLGIS